MSFLCGFGRKSKKEKPSTYLPNGRAKKTISEGDSGSHSKTKAKESHVITHTHNKGLHDHERPSTNPRLDNKSPDKITPTSVGHRERDSQKLQNGGNGPSKESKIIAQEGPRLRVSERDTVDRNYNTIVTETVPPVIHSFKEAQEIQRLAEQIMSGDTITGADITGNHKMETSRGQFLDIQKSHPAQRRDAPGEPLGQSGKADEAKREYITADKMVADDFYYKMNHRRRGTCIIINVGEFLPITRMNNRNGYLVDGELMKGTFARLGFDVHYVKNPTSIKLRRALEQVSLADHTDVDCLAVVIMSHGNRDFGDVIFTKDGIMHLDYIIEFFNGRSCPQLAGKPKLFFVQACRGDKLDEGQELPYIDEDVDELDAAPSAPRIPIEADILLSQATSAGYISFRNSQKGSIYIRCLTKALAEHSEDEDIISILTRVNAMVAFEFESNSNSKMEFHAKKQMPAFTSQLTKKLQFPPLRTKKR